ncbi:olfactory receptor 2AT4-like [Nerophis lumbriciformis]|uniref:olfactory receptor 2AT4-like n=1 Tax=Nerophis lumbriciformis TaxID=546530 RepID=UPI002ADF3981|nr:olfactory receptor 2AT4-like [Nerophis lumbriciformis]
MSSTNGTRIRHFFLLGFAGLPPKYYAPLSVLLLVVFLAIAGGNTFIIILVKMDRLLHKPTYLIFCHLALTDLAFGAVTLPRIIWKYWVGDSLISFPACFVQMYFVHFLGATHSFILMVMALDRLLAVCLPLRYVAVFTNTTVTVLCGASWLMPIVWMVSLVLDALTLPYCGSNVIVQCYCDHIGIMALSCEETQEVEAVAFGLAMFSLLFPLTFVIASYLVIIVTVMRVCSPNSRMKALSTCTPQLLTTCLYYTPRCFVYMANNVGFTFSVPLRITVIMTYSLLPAAVNPLIYCFKTQHIKETLKKKFCSSKIRA